ncbi:HNH endonuclease signature motif containing protein [Subtercola endophyticus]|uniref:HNH endonuclease signature motif containing protein n=1 Tax=Subtercola endophyticus TaxID=2895559 RepID=UPI001E316E47|nr:HNH endonuclease signature motif containing protein [Subtercola endophyticus]UFS60302.1 HNH endonuclease [Subtercola endophyticus]
MNRANLTASDPQPRHMLRERYAAAVSAVVNGAHEVARVHAQQAARIEKARLACEAMGFADQSTGGPGWSPDVVTQRVLVTELAVALHLSETDARRQVDTAEGLAGAFAATRLALEAGRISYRHAEKIVEHGRAVPPESLADYEARLLPVATRVSVQRLVRHARAVAEEAQAATSIERHQAAIADRHITFDPAADGMAFLTHYLPAVEAVAIYNRATDVARGLKSSGDPRTLAQLRADVLTDLMVNGETSIPGATKGVRAHVLVTVPALTLLKDELGATLEPGSSPAPHSHHALGPDAAHAHPGDANAWAADLDGYGPIDRLTALELTREAPSFYRVLTDAVTGVALNYGRTRYKPPADLDQLIRAVHLECTFPLDCSPSSTADLDHTEPWESGANTAFANLSPLCSSHHKVKHHTEWKVVQDPAGSGAIIWTSPAGFEYVVASTPIARPAALTIPRFAEAPPPYRYDSPQF